MSGISHRCRSVRPTLRTTRPDPGDSVKTRSVVQFVLDQISGTHPKVLLQTPGWGTPESEVRQRQPGAVRRGRRHTVAVRAGLRRESHVRRSQGPLLRMSAVPVSGAALPGTHRGPVRMLTGGIDYEKAPSSTRPPSSVGWRGSGSSGSGSGLGWYELDRIDRPKEDPLAPRSTPSDSSPSSLRTGQQAREQRLIFPPGRRWRRILYRSGRGRAGVVRPSDPRSSICQMARHPDVGGTRAPAGSA